jgi:AraC family transcriptional regulator of adaptative response/methylated-DNA-[protein]-cysteine methyltransferase
MKPQTFRTSGAGEHIQHVVLPSSLGQVLVAATDKGICDVTLGDDPDALEADLARRFPAAEHRKADKAFSMLAATVFDTIDGEPGRSMELPLDLRGTAFQMRVWQALRRIPSGTTTSYGDLAQAIGAPRAVRAVAQACGANPVAIIVPCHRVIGKDGAITGYRWGIERKKALLDRESRGSPTSQTTPAKKPRARKARNA